MANRKTATQMLAEACGKPFDEVLQDSSRTFYMSPDEAVEYGLIDKVRETTQLLLHEDTVIYTLTEITVYSSGPEPIQREIAFSVLFVLHLG